MTSTRDPSSLVDDKTFWAVSELVRRKSTLEEVREISLADVEQELRRAAGWHHCPECRSYFKPSQRLGHVVCSECGAAFKSVVK